MCVANMLEIGTQHNLSNTKQLPAWEERSPSHSEISAMGMEFKKDSCNGVCKEVMTIIMPH